MKKTVICCAAMLLFLVARVSVSQAQTAKVSLTGEVIDMDCYMSKGAHGADHKTCGLKCVANGGPMGLLTKDGKVYVLTPPHDNQDAFNKLKKEVSSTVTITGETYSKGGVQSMEVDDVRM